MILLSYKIIFIYNIMIRSTSSNSITKSNNNKQNLKSDVKPKYTNSKISNCAICNCILKNKIIYMAYDFAFCTEKCRKIALKRFNNSVSTNINLK